jgi:hypothetical protein
MERLLKNQQIPLVQVIDPISGQQYYAPESAIYTTSTDSNPVILKSVIVDQAASASYFSGSADRAISASYALTASYSIYSVNADRAQTSSYSATSLSASFASTASYATNHAIITSSYICEGILASNQTFATASDVKILFVRYDDPNGWIASNQFQPNIAGYYSISFGVWLQNPGIANNQVNTQMRKNGNSMILSQQPLNNGTGISLGGSRIIRMNGTTDYIDWTIFQGTAGSGTTGTLLQGTANGSGTWFSAFLITQ